MKFTNYTLLALFAISSTSKWMAKADDEEDGFEESGDDMEDEYEGNHADEEYDDNYPSGDEGDTQNLLRSIEAPSSYNSLAAVEELVQQKNPYEAQYEGMTNEEIQDSMAQQVADVSNASQNALFDVLKGHTDFDMWLIQTQGPQALDIPAEDLKGLRDIFEEATAAQAGYSNPDLNQKLIGGMSVPATQEIEKEHLLLLDKQVQDTRESLTDTEEVVRRGVDDLFKIEIETELKKNGKLNEQGDVDENDIETELYKKQQTDEYKETYKKYIDAGNEGLTELIKKLEDANPTIIDVDEDEPLVEQLQEVEEQVEEDLEDKDFIQT